MNKITNVIATRRARNRSVPPPPPFDPSALPDNALLTAKELAGWLRFSISTLECWRLQHPNRGPLWVMVGGKIRYRVVDVKKWLLVDPPPKLRSASRSQYLEAQNVGQ